MYSIQPDFPAHRYKVIDIISSRGDEAVEDRWQDTGGGITIVSSTVGNEAAEPRDLAVRSTKSQGNIRTNFTCSDINQEL